MKKYLIGFVVAIILIALAYGAYPFIRGFFGNSGPVSPENLRPGVTDYGSLRVEVFGRGAPLSDVEVDLGEIGPNGPTGPMSYAVTDTAGIASFERVPVGSYDIFFNTNHFPSGYMPPQSVPVSIVKDQEGLKRINLSPK